MAALALSLAGDVFLMLPSDQFVPGLASFLLGHIAYIVGLQSLDTSATGLVIGLVVVLVAAMIAYRRKIIRKCTSLREARRERQAKRINVRCSTLYQIILKGAVTKTDSGSLLNGIKVPCHQTLYLTKFGDI